MPILLTLLLAAAAAAAPDAASPGAGCLYGTVVTADGDTLTGFLRTDAWDTFWDDVFTASRTASPWADHIDADALAKERRAEYFKDHGLVDRLAYVLSGDDRKVDAARQFLCRYGQIARLDLADRDEAVVETVDGGRHPVRRRGRDLRGELTVAGTDSVVLDYDDVRLVVFADAPAGALPPWRRLAGTVTTADGTLAGFVRWDLSESVDLDLLDGEDDSGDHEVPMGTIAVIAKERDGSRVTLRDGRELLLTGTNDVNADNRGIAVEVAGLGRVTVPWRQFERVEFAPPGPSGPGRNAYGPGRELTGEIVDTDGRTARGRLVWDLDEGWTWDLLNGSRDGREYDIPFARIARIEPAGTGARVFLRTGEVLDLDEGTDVTGESNGVLVLGGPGPVHVPWRRLAAAAFAE